MKAVNVQANLTQSVEETKEEQPVENGLTLIQSAIPKVDSFPSGAVEPIKRKNPDDSQSSGVESDNDADLLVETEAMQRL